MQMSTNGWQEVAALEAAWDVQQHVGDVIREEVTLNVTPDKGSGLFFHIFVIILVRDTDKT